MSMYVFFWDNRGSYCLIVSIFSRGHLIYDREKIDGEGGGVVDT